MEPQRQSTGEIRLAKAGREQVLAAADEILREGRRPTIEAIQSRLGGGSPNGIVAYLKDWYSELGARLARTDTPAEGLHPEVHRVALELQRAIARNQSPSANAQSTETLIRSLRAEVASLKLLLDEMRIQRGRDQQTLADARVLLVRKDEELQKRHAQEVDLMVQLTILQQRRRPSRATPTSKKKPAPKKRTSVRTVKPARARKKADPRRAKRVKRTSRVRSKI